MSRSLRLCLMLCLALAACDGESRHLLFVELRTDLVPGPELATLELVIDEGTETITFSEGDEPLVSGRRIHEVWLAPGQHDGTLRLLAPDGALLVRERPFAFVMSSARILEFTISRRCRDDSCPEGQLCFGRVCAPPECRTGTERMCFGADQCELDEDCDGERECAVATCTPGRQCLFVADPSRCAEDERCDLDEGCVPLENGCTEDNCVGDACNDATCEGDVCVLTPSIACDDDNPCTRDRCDVAAGGCVFEPDLEGQCNDGVFCNGSEVCEAGLCVEGDPPCANACSELEGRCLTCTGDPDCGPAYDGPRSACGFGGDTCAETGTRTFMHFMPRCDAGGECVTDAVEMSESCTRASRDGRACGTDPPDGDPVCVADDVCSANGTLEFEVTRHRCASGACEPNTFTETGGTCATGIQDNDVCPGGNGFRCCNGQCGSTRWSPLHCSACGVECNGGSCNGRGAQQAGIAGHCECDTVADCPGPGFECDNGDCQCIDDSACQPGQRCVERWSVRVCEYL